MMDIPDLERLVTAEPGQTVFLRPKRPLTAYQQEEIFSRLKGVCSATGVRVVLVDAGMDVGTHREPQP